MPHVEIILKGHLDSHWSEWLGDLSITHLPKHQTRLWGELPDQAALYGLLSKLRDLGIQLISFSCGEHPSIDLEEGGME